MKRTKTGRPAVNRTRLVITLPAKMVERLKRSAAEQGRPVGYVVEDAVRAAKGRETAPAE